jgi:hypothetical protein
MHILYDLRRLDNTAGLLAQGKIPVSGALKTLHLRPPFTFTPATQPIQASPFWHGPQEAHFL